MTERWGDSVLEEMLGAYALDALEPAERTAVDELLQRRPDLAEEADRLVRAAAWVGASEALAAPPSLRDDLFAQVHARAVPDGLDAAARTYASSVARLESTLQGLDPADDDETTANGLDVRGLVVHLLAQESAVAQIVGTPVVIEIDELDIPTRTAAFIDRFADASRDDVLDLWQCSAAAVELWAAASAGSTELIPWGGITFTRESLLLARAFENWIHRDDLCRAQGRVSEPPPAMDVHEMTSMSVQTLPFGLERVGHARPGKTARMVLTGPGGGDWMISLGGAPVVPDTVPDLTMTANALDWCLVAGERLAPEDFAFTTEGDATLADDLIAAAPAYATL